MSDASAIVYALGEISGRLQRTIDQLEQLPEVAQARQVLKALEARLNEWGRTPEGQQFLQFLKNLRSNNFELRGAQVPRAHRP